MEAHYYLLTDLIIRLLPAFGTFLLQDAIFPLVGFFILGGLWSLIAGLWDR